MKLALVDSSPGSSNSNLLGRLMSDPRQGTSFIAKQYINLDTFTKAISDWKLQYGSKAHWIEVVTEGTRQSNFPFDVCNYQAVYSAISSFMTPKTELYLSGCLTGVDDFGPPICEVLQVVFPGKVFGTLGITNEYCLTESPKHVMCVTDPSEHAYAFGKNWMKVQKASAVVGCGSKAFTHLDAPGTRPVYGSCYGPHVFLNLKDKGLLDALEDIVSKQQALSGEGLRVASEFSIKSKFGVIEVLMHGALLKFKGRIYSTSFDRTVREKIRLLGSPVRRK